MKDVTPARSLSRPARTRAAAPTADFPVGAASSSRSSACTVCRSPKRATVDAALAAGGTIRAVAGAHGFSIAATFRHGKKCLPAKLARASAERKEQVTAGTLLDEMVDLQRTTQEQLEAAIAAKHRPAEVARLIKVAQEGIALQGRFLGAFVGENAKSVDNRVQILAMRDMSIDELRALTDSLRSRPK